MPYIIALTTESPKDPLTQQMKTLHERRGHKHTLAESWPEMFEYINENAADIFVLDPDFQSDTKDKETITCRRLTLISLKSLRVQHKAVFVNKDQFAGTDPDSDLMFWDKTIARYQGVELGHMLMDRIKHHLTFFLKQLCWAINVICTEPWSITDVDALSFASNVHVSSLNKHIRNSRIKSASRLINGVMLLHIFPLLRMGYERGAMEEVEGEEEGVEIFPEALLVRDSLESSEYERYCSNAPHNIV